MSQVSTASVIVAPYVLLTFRSMFLPYMNRRPKAHDGIHAEEGELGTRRGTQVVY